MRFATLTSFLLAGVSVVAAADFRELVAIPAGDTMAVFTTDFVSTCSTWYPAENGDSLHLLDARVTPGDYQGNNVDTEALVVCTWVGPNEGDPVQDFTVAVAEAVGATPISE
ncbi:hypothetical protein MSAN_00307100 [Mycena sanguinolenta]|uniref:Uncharacterized protein n=1 Tax=Mycena sanguinolenta TaxID=230812 RepID=A0A8H6ZBA6_9AGAR|nr:hypothetical protein MSAN_00307100 [Mycena sanguinolenta]